MQQQNRSRQIFLQSILEVFTREMTTQREYNSLTIIQHLLLPMYKLHKAMRKLKMNKASGPDALPPRLYKKCATTLTFPLFLLFNKSLSTGIFPTIWKMAHVGSIYKRGSKYDAKNYRPSSNSPQSQN